MWSNFFDAESGISKYLVCIGNQSQFLVSAMFQSVLMWVLSRHTTQVQCGDRARVRVIDCMQLSQYATTLFPHAIPPLCRNFPSDGIGLDETPPILLEVNDGYQEGEDWQQQGFVNSILGNWKVVDDMSDISEYEVKIAFIIAQKEIM